MRQGFNTLSSILAPFVYGFFIAYLLNPGVCWVEKHILGKFDRRGGYSRFRRILSIFTIYILMIGCTAWVFAYVLPQIATSIRDLLKNFPTNVSKLEVYLYNLANEYPYLKSSEVEALITENVQPILQRSSTILNFALSYILSSALGITKLLLGLMIAFYMLNEKERFVKQSKKLLHAFLKEEVADKIISIGSESHQAFSKFFIGKTIDSLIIGVICFVGLLFLNIPYALLISVIIAITNMIPYFGPFIGAIPAILITLLSSPMQAVTIALFIFALQQFDGMILGPKILGDSTGLSPFWVIFSILIGGAFFGFLGMLLGVPVFAVLSTMFGRVVDRKWDEKNEIKLQLKAEITSAKELL